MEEKSYKEYLKYITTFVFDVDGVLTDGTITVTTQGDLLRTMSIRDGFALKTAVDQGFHVCIISGGYNEGLRLRLKGLGITDIHLGVQYKLDVLKEYMELYQIDPSQVLYMGDDIPDMYPMQMVGLPCCPQDATPEIKAISKYISNKDGGKGCVRDVIEQVLKVHDKWSKNMDAQHD
jgi:3-deoxy-D-manno-octulosonate 8-phosphate phosphatase (KDO 8-P phosphatase)